MNKEEFVKNLKNVKVILGNGFDLHCGLYTKYSDYYCQNYRKFVFIQKQYKEYINNDNYELDFNDEKISRLNIWDIFFALNSSNNPYECKQRWCDIESLMKDSFVDTKNVSTEEFFKHTFYDSSSINWPMVKRIVERRETNERDSQGFISEFVLFKMESFKRTNNSFYDLLLSELKEFEKSFGQFIYWQLHYGKVEERQFGVLNLNTLYIERAKYVLNCLCDLSSAKIDSFNYSYIHDKELMKKTNYINGYFESPIFGIDTCFEPDDDKFIFTKTCRRMDDEINDSDHLAKEEFDNVVIFGHSLNEADYSYFFPLFDKLELLDSTANGVLVFAYFIYDKENESQIKANLRLSISNIIYAYAKDKGVSNPKRFLDTLSTNRRVLTYEILDFPDRLKLSKTRLDGDWDRIYKEIDNLKENNND